MGGENRSDFRHLRLQTEKAGSAHPFVKLGNGGFTLRSDQDIIKGFNDFPAGIAEHDRFHIIPPAGNGIHPVILPDPEEKLFFIVFFSKTNQNDFRFAGNFPASKTAGDFLDGDPLSDLFPEDLFRLFKFKIGFQVRSQQNILIAIGRYGFPELAHDHRVNPADLVANLPTDLKQIPVLISYHGLHPLSDDGFLCSCLEKSSRIFM